jgi:hypothetical protein
MLRPPIVWSLRSQCIVLAIAPVAMWLGVLEYRHQQDVQLVRTMNRETLQEIAGLDIEEQIASLKQQIEMNLATPLLDEDERQSEIEILNCSLAKAHRLREIAQADRDQYSCAVSR